MDEEKIFQKTNIKGGLMKKKKYIIAAIGLLLIGGIYWYKKSQSREVQVQYVTSAAEKGSITSSISASGSVVVDDSANVDPTINGTVANLAVSVGDEVRKGQVLFNIINDDLGISVSSAKISLIQAQQSVESSKASKRQADYDLDHHDGSLATKKILENKLDAAELSLTAAKDNVALAQAKYQKALSDYNEKNVKSPIDGTVNAVNIKNGDDLSRLSSNSNSSAPIVIGDLSTLKAEIFVNEVDVANVAVGQKAVITLDAINGVDFTGKVEKIDALGTIQSGVVSYTVTVSFDELDSRIKPSMTASVSIITDVKQDVIVVPSTAVKNDKGNSYVQVMVNGAPEMRNITVGIENDSSAEIVKGLNIGDEIVTETVDSSATNSSSSSSGRNNNSFRVPGMGGGFR